MALEFSLDNGQGQSGTVTVQNLMSQLQAQGENPVSVSPDGMTLTLSDGQGTFDVKTQDVLKGLGWNVMGLKPQNADYSNVQPGWRAAVNKLPDDMSRQAYIEGRMRELGHQQVQVVGSGRDWYVFNPQTSQWVGVTNSPDWDSSDLVEAGLEAPRMVASGLAGGASLLSGGGAWAAPLAAGAAGGGVDVLERAALAGLDPTYRDVVGKNLGQTAKDVAFGAGLDAASVGVAKALPAAARFASPKLAGALEGVFDRGIASRAATNLGGAANMAGSLGADMAEGLAGSPLGRQAAGAAIPGVSDLGLGGDVLQMAGGLPRTGARALGHLGQSETLQRFAPGAANWAEETSQRLLRPGTVKPGLGERIQGGLQRFANRMRPSSAAPMAEEAGASSVDVMENLFRDSAEGLHRRMGLGRQGLEDYRLARQYGLTAQEAKGIADEGRAVARQKLGDRVAKIGRRVGRGFQTVERVGEAMTNAADSAVGGALGAAQLGGRALQYGGAGLKGLGTLTGPLEARGALRYGAEEAYRPRMEESNPWRRRQPSYMMDLDLAQN